MAERLRKMHQDDVRTKIQTSQLINRLTDHALGTVELVATQVRAIEVLLKKVLPDLQAVEHSGEVATSPTYDLSILGDETLAQLERSLELARPADGDQAGASASKPSIVH